MLFFVFINKKKNSFFFPAIIMYAANNTVMKLGKFWHFLADLKKIRNHPKIDIYLPKIFFWEMLLQSGFGLATMI